MVITLVVESAGLRFANKYIRCADRHGLAAGHLR